MRKAAVVIFALAGVAFLATPLTSFAGGTVTGKVTYSGKAEEKEFLFSKFPNPKFCPKNPNPELVKGEKRILPTIQGRKGIFQARRACCTTRTPLRCWAPAPARSSISLWLRRARSWTSRWSSARTSKAHSCGCSVTSMSSCRASSSRCRIPITQL